MSFKNKGFILAAAGLLISVFMFQNFIISSIDQTSLKAISQIDPQLAQVLDKLDKVYLTNYSQLEKTKAYGRLAEIEYEHRKMKSDIIRAAAVINPNLIELSGETGNFSAVSGALSAIANQIRSRRNFYVVSVQNAKTDSKPTTINIVWAGVNNPQPLFDVVLVSNVNHDWIINEQNVKPMNVVSYVVNNSSGLPAKSVISWNNPPRSREFNSNSPLQPNTTSKAYYLMDELIKKNVYFDFRLKTSFNVNAGGTLTITVTDEAPVTTPSYGALSAKRDGVSYMLPPSPVIAPKSIFPTSITAQEAIDYVDFYNRNFTGEGNLVEIYWRGVLIKRAVGYTPPPTAPPPAPVTMGTLTYYMNGVLVLTQTNILESDAIKYCQEKSLSNTSGIITCLWNGMLIFNREAPITSTPPQPTPILSTYTDLNSRIFTPKCLACHSSTNPSGGFDISNYNLIIANGYVLRGYPQQSRLYIRLLNDPLLNVHPPTGALTSVEMDAIKLWILNGAPQ